MSNDQSKIITALVKAQKTFGPALKTKTNPHLKNRYADLGSVIEAVIDALNDNEIFLSQRLVDCDTGVKLETILYHVSGQSLSSGMVHLPVSKNDAQGYGSAMTYARRYSLMVVCGIAPEDDDGNSASHVNQSKAPPASKPRSENPAVKNEAPASEAQIKKLFAMSKERHISQDVLRGTLKGLYSVESTKDLKRWHMDDLFLALERPDCNEETLAVFAANENTKPGAKR